MLWQFIIMVLIMCADYTPPIIPIPNWVFPGATYKEVQVGRHSTNKIKPKMVIFHYTGEKGNLQYLDAMKTWNYFDSLGKKEGTTPDRNAHGIFNIDGSFIQMLPMGDDWVQESWGSKGYNNEALNFEMPGYDIIGKLHSSDPKEKGIAELFMKSAGRIAFEAHNKYNIPYESMFGHSEKDTVVFDKSYDKTGKKYIGDTSIPCIPGTPIPNKEDGTSFSKGSYCHDRGKEPMPMDMIIKYAKEYERRVNHIKE